ncbi:hypothetical protein YC2023_060133 [Brassica napus]
MTLRHRDVEETHGDDGCNHNVCVGDSLYELKLSYSDDAPSDFFISLFESFFLLQDDESNERGSILAGCRTPYMTLEERKLLFNRSSSKTTTTAVDLRNDVYSGFTADLMKTQNQIPTWGRVFAYVALKNNGILRDNLLNSHLLVTGSVDASPVPNMSMSSGLEL